ASAPTAVLPALFPISAPNAPPATAPVAAPLCVLLMDCIVAQLPNSIAELATDNPNNAILLFLIIALMFCFRIKVQTECQTSLKSHVSDLTPIFRVQLSAWVASERPAGRPGRIFRTTP